MKYPTLIRMAAFAMAFAAAGGVSVRASVITLDVSATTSPQFSAVSCSPTCTLGGDIVIDNTVGTVQSANVTATGFSPVVGPFTRNLGISNLSTLLTSLTIGDAVEDSLTIAFATPTLGSLVGYTGGSLSPDSNSHVFAAAIGARGVWSPVSGSLTEHVAVPAPLIGRGLPIALAVSGVFFGVKLLERDRKRHPLGTQAPG